MSDCILILHKCQGQQLSYILTNIDNQAESNVGFKFGVQFCQFVNCKIRQSKVLGLTRYDMYDLYFSLVLVNFEK